MSNQERMEDFFPSELLTEIRYRMANMESDPYIGKRIFFENAGGSLKLNSVVETAKEESSLPDNAGRSNASSEHVASCIKNGQDDAKLFLGAKSGQLIAAQTTSQAIFRVVRAIAENIPGKNIVTTNLEHPSVYDSTNIYAKEQEMEWRVAGLNRQKGKVDPQQILEQIDEDTCLLAFIHASNITGAVLDVKKIIKEARKIKKDLFIIVDGTQHAPHAPVDVDSLECDAYFFAPYKILGKTGIGFGYISDRVVKLPHDNLLGKNSCDWNLGTQEQASYACWSKVIDYLAWLGGHFTQSADRRMLVETAMINAEKHERSLLYRLLLGTEQRQGLLSMKKVVVYGMDDDISHRDCVIAFNVEGKKASEVVELLQKERIIVHNRIMDPYSKHTLQAMEVDELVRLSALHYNSPQEVDIILDAIAQI